MMGVQLCLFCTQNTTPTAWLASPSVHFLLFLIRVGEGAGDCASRNTPQRGRSSSQDTHTVVNGVCVCVRVDLDFLLLINAPSFPSLLIIT